MGTSSNNFISDEVEVDYQRSVNIINNICNNVDLKFIFPARLELFDAKECAKNDSNSIPDVPSNQNLEAEIQRLDHELNDISECLATLNTQLPNDLTPEEIELALNDATKRLELMANNIKKEAGTFTGCFGTNFAVPVDNVRSQPYSHMAPDVENCKLKARIINEVLISIQTFRDMTTTLDTWVPGKEKSPEWPMHETKFKQRLTKWIRVLKTAVHNERIV